MNVITFYTTIGAPLTDTKHYFGERQRRSSCFPCSCKSNSLNCGRRGFYNVPVIINRFTSGAAYLDLSNNLISKLDMDDLYYYPSLTLIDMTNNEPYCNVVCVSEYTDTIRIFNKRGITVLNNCVCSNDLTTSRDISNIEETVSSYKDYTKSEDYTKSVSTSVDSRTSTSNMPTTEIITEQSISTRSVLTTIKSTTKSTTKKKTTTTTSKKPPIEGTDIPTEKPRVKIPVLPSRGTDYDTTDPFTEDTSMFFSVSFQIKNKTADKWFLNETQIIVVTVVPTGLLILLFLLLLCCRICNVCSNCKFKCRKSVDLIRESCKGQKDPPTVDLLTVNFRYLSLDETASDMSMEIYSITDPAVISVNDPPVIENTSVMSVNEPPVIDNTRRRKSVSVEKDSPVVVIQKEKPKKKKFKKKPTDKRKGAKESDLSESDF